MSLVAPILFALGTWWLSTVLMMWWSQRSRPRCAVTLAFMTLLAVAGAATIALTRDWTGPAGAYLSFLGGLSLWAWHEMSYFLGSVTGPRPRACPPGANHWQRLWFGIQASLWHELAIVATAAGLVWLTHDSVNPFGTVTFIALWALRWSAKLNIFLGVRNLHEEFWPDHLRYLGSYVRHASMNVLFPVSMVLGGLALVFMVQEALAAPAGGLHSVGWTLSATLLALGLLEHLLLFLSVPDAVLWRLATGQRNANGSTDLAVNATAGPGS